MSAINEIRPTEFWMRGEQECHIVKESEVHTARSPFRAWKYFLHALTINSCVLVRCGIMFSFRSLRKRSSSHWNSGHSTTLRDLWARMWDECDHDSQMRTYLVICDDEIHQISVKCILIKYVALVWHWHCGGCAGCRWLGFQIALDYLRPPLLLQYLPV